MDLLLPTVALLAVVAVTAGLARRFGLLSPLLLLVVGLVLSVVPGVPAYRLDPQLVLVVILPLLLYVAALRTSVPTFRANVRPIGLLAIGHVVVIAIAVGFVLHAVVPEVPLAAAIALGAIVAPPDAVAATALARRVGLPRRVVAILEGESLVNDATALVLLRVAVMVAIGDSVGPATIAWDVLRSAAGGVAVGLLVAAVIAWLHRRTDDPLLDNTISLLTPFAAFIPAEEIHASGVVAVVVCGLWLGQRELRLMSAASRLQMEAFWRVVEFLLQNAVFVVVGLQLPEVLRDLRGPWQTTVLASVVVVATVVLGRILWVFPATYVPRLLSRVRTRDPVPPWSVPAVIGWAGMRGVVTAAAAVSLPLATLAGKPFPRRDLLVWLAFVVVVVTLLGQATSLPLLARKLRVPTDDATADALATASARRAAAQAGRERLEQLLTTSEVPETVVTRLRHDAQIAEEAPWERLGDQVGPWEVYARLRRQMIEVELAHLGGLRQAGRLPEEEWERLRRELDLEDAILSQSDETALDGERATTARDACPHLAEHPQDTEIEPVTLDGCTGCLEEGRTDWVHLRLCLTCGYVGCCDSSPRRHATSHFQATSAGDDAHPVMRSFERDESWRWCFIDELIG
ncbi:MAG: Na+/H+ antiporter [Actinomycetales bacterium]